MLILDAGTTGQWLSGLPRIYDTTAARYQRYRTADQSGSSALCCGCAHLLHLRNFGLLCALCPMDKESRHIARGLLGVVLFTWNYREAARVTWEAGYFEGPMNVAAEGQLPPLGSTITLRW